MEHPSIDPIRPPLTILMEERDPGPPKPRVEAEEPPLCATDGHTPRVGHLAHRDERARHCPDRCGIGTLRLGFALLAKSPSLATCRLVLSSVVPNSFSDLSIAVAS